MGVKRTIRSELQHRFLKIEIPSVSKCRSDTGALFVHRGGGELRTFFDQTSLVGSDGTNGFIGDIDLVPAYRIGLMRRDEIGEVELTFLDSDGGVHLGMEITHVVHLLAQLLHADLRQLRVIDHRRLAHLLRVACQPLVGFSGRVQRSSVVDVELSLPESENLRVLPLAEIVPQRRGRDGLVIDAFDLCFVEQILALRHKFRGITRR